MNAEENVGRTIVSGGIWRLLAFGFASLLGVVATAIVSRELGPADFAMFTTAISLIAIATTIPDIGLLALGLREFAALEGAERDRNQRALITLRLITATIGAVAIVLFALLAGYPDEIVIGLAVAGIGLLGLSMHISYAVPIQATYRLRTMAVLEAGRQIMIAGLMIVAVLATGEAGPAIAVYLPAGVLLAAVTALIARRIAPIVPSFDTEAMLGLLRKVGTFAIAGSIGGIYAYVAQIISNSILTPHDSGNFALVFRVYAVMLSACITAVSGAFPLLVSSSRSDSDRLTYATRRLIQTTFLAGVGGAVALITGASFIVSVIGGAEFSDANGVMAVIGLALPASFVLITGNSYLLAADHHRALVWISLLGALVSIALTAALAATFGLYGAAAGLVLGEAIIATSYIRKISQVDKVALAGPGWALAVLAVGAVSCAAALLPLPSAVCAVIGLGTFAVLATGLKLVPPELIDRLPLIGNKS